MTNHQPGHQTSQPTGAGPWQFWIDRGGTFTDLVSRQAPDGALSHPQAAVGESRTLSRTRRIQGIRELLEPRCDGAPFPARAPSTPSRWAPRSRRTRCWNARASARSWPSPRVFATPADRLPEPARDLRPRDRAARTALRAGDRDRRTRERPRRGAAHRLINRRRTPGAFCSNRRVSPMASGPRPSCSCTATAITNTRQAGGRPGAGDRLRPRSRCRRGQPLDEARRARRHHSGRRLCLADPAALCRSGGRNQLGDVPG